MAIRSAPVNDSKHASPIAVRAGAEHRKPRPDDGRPRRGFPPVFARPIGVTFNYEQDQIVPTRKARARRTDAGNIHPSHNHEVVAKSREGVATPVDEYIMIRLGAVRGSGSRGVTS